MRTILIALTLALIALPALAQTQQQRDWCYSSTATDDQTIQGCTALIQSGQETPANQAVAYDDRAGAYINKELYDQVIADESQALALHPTANAYYGRAEAYGAKGLFDQAIADLTQSIALKPDYAIAYDVRGIAYYAVGRYDQAIADYTQALVLKPDYAAAYANRGVVYETKGLHDLAVTDYRAALKIVPTQKRAQDGLNRLGVTP